MNREPRDTMLLFARQELGFARSAEFTAWATQALVDGFDNPSLRLLAGLDLSVPWEVRKDEVDELHRQALEEIGIETPSREASLRWHLRFLASKISSGELAPREGLDQIHRDVVTRLGHPKDLHDWCALWSMDPNESHSIKASEIETEVLEAAAELLGDADESGRR